MPNVLLSQETMCTALRKDGFPCSAPRLSGALVCLAHDEERSSIAHAKRSRTLHIVVRPVEALQTLLELDMRDESSLRRLSIGLRQHIAARTLDYREAVAIMRLAHEEHALAPRKSTSATAEMVRAVLAEKPALEPD